MKTLITGATGFIGHRLLEQLFARGESLRVLCRNLPAAGASDHASIERYQGDLLDPGSVSHAVNGCTLVYHLAGFARAWARDPGEFFDVNVTGTRNVLEAAMQHGVRRVVVTSSIVAIGPSNGSPACEGTIRRSPMLTPYEQSKVAAEQIAAEYVRRGLDVVIVNPTRIFGPGLMNEGNSATRMINMYIEGKWRLLPGDGRAAGNYGYVEDVARGHILAMERGTPGERYILGGENATFIEFFEAVARAAGRRRIMLHVPRSLAIAGALGEELRARAFNGYPSITSGWVRLYYLDGAYSLEKAIRELGYTVTPLQDALDETIVWLRSGRPNSN